MKGYSIRLNFRNNIKDLRFMIEDDTGADEKWGKANEELDAIGDSCSGPMEFFEKASAHYATFGFQRVAK